MMVLRAYCKAKLTQEYQNNQRLLDDLHTSTYDIYRYHLKPPTMDAIFSVDSEGHVSITYYVQHRAERQRVERIFMCPEEGGFVRERQDILFMGERLWLQVCERFADSGLALTCPNRAALLACIQREFRLMLKDAQKAIRPTFKTGLIKQHELAPQMLRHAA